MYVISILCQLFCIHHQRDEDWKRDSQKYVETYRWGGSHLKKRYPVLYPDLLSVVYRRNNSWWKCTFLDLIQSRWLRFEPVTVTRSYGTPLSEYETELGQGSSWKINGPCRIHMLKHYRIAWQDHRLVQTNYRPSKSIALPTPYFCQFPLSSPFRSILFTFPLSVSIF